MTLLTHAQLKAKHLGQYISYQGLLGTQEWKAKRDAIVIRDRNVCTKCGCMPTDSGFIGNNPYHLISIPRDPNSLVEVGNFLFRGEELGDEIIDVGGPIVLHVHHLYYEKSKCPWQYPGDALITLCSNCHLEVHRKEVVPVYGIENGSRIKIPVRTCRRCNGAGYFPQFNHVEAGVCFECKGKRYTNLEI